MASQAELEANLMGIRSAQSKIIDGERVGEVAYQGINVKYTNVTLPQLAEEETRLKRLLARFTRQNYSLISTGKGF